MRQAPILALGMVAVLVPAALGGDSTSGGFGGRESCPASIVGVWTTGLNADRLFGVRLTITETDPERFTARLTHGGVSEHPAVWLDHGRIRFHSSRMPLGFEGELSADRQSISAFFRDGSSAVHRQLRRASRSPATWEARWSPLGLEPDTVSLDLHIVQEDDGPAGYLFFRDQRFPLPWTYGLACDGGAVTFSERNFALGFQGRIDDSGAALVGTLRNGAYPVVFTRIEGADPSPGYWTNRGIPPRGPDDSTAVAHAPPGTDDGWRTATPAGAGLNLEPLRDLVRAIADREMTNTHAVLIARHGRLAFEEYFYGFDRTMRHDLRSAAKTFAATLIGIAIDQGRIGGVDARALDFFPRYRHYANWDDRKARITVRHLLTMSSGLDADDGNRESVASESAYQGQSAQPDWIRFALDAPMIAEPGARTLYGGANPLILGGILDAVTDEPVEWFVDRELFGPLGIEHYRFLVDPSGVLYMGGGVHMAPRDMAKFGQLHLDGGTWNGERIVSEAWVRESMGNYTRLENRWDNEYGYLWWHRDYQVGDRTVHSIEARGAGGQYIFVVPELDLVAVITSGNYTNGRFRQPEEIVERFILPAAVTPDPD